MIKTIVLVAAAGAAACGGKGGAAGTVGHAASGAGEVALPGPCVDPMADGKHRLGAMFAVRADGPFSGDAPFAEEEPSARPGPDLDGDGAPERIILSPGSEAWLQAGLEAHLYYVMRGGCGHYVGDVIDVEPTLGAERHHGLADLEAVESGNCEGARCGCEYGTWRYRFDGRAYRKDEATSTDSSERSCPDE